ncbi:MAG: tyrosine-protein phosphatase [Sarcina sp.]
MMIDMHSHIVYAIDDGAKTLEISLEMLRTAEQSRTKKIVLTPHYFLGRFMCEFKDVKEKVNEMRIIAKQNEIDIEIYHGQEVYLTRSIIEQLVNGEIGTINDSRYMLIEFNLCEIDEKAKDLLYELRMKKIVPIIAHPERYRDFQKDRTLINEYSELGCLFQLNANSISGLLGKEAKELAQVFLENDIYSFIGSDAHGTGKRNTNMKQYKKLIEEIKPDFIAETVNNSNKVLNDEVVDFKGNKVKAKKKGFFSFFKK